MLQVNNPFRKKPKFWKKITIFSILLFPVSMVYLVLHLLYHICAFRKKVKIPVISVGSPVIGGSGKTPLTKSIAKYITLELGKKVAILTRGYPAIVKGVIKVSSVTKVCVVGDEALELSSIAPTYAASNMYKAALKAVEDGAEIILLDDGMQQRYLAVDYQIMVIDREYMFGNKLLFPAGPIRHSLLSAFKRTNEMYYTSYKDLVIKSKHKADKYFLLAAIADPEKFINLCEKEGIIVAKHYLFPNHHVYSTAELKEVYENKNPIITTLKDYVKIPKQYRNKTEVLVTELPLTKRLKINLKNMIIDFTQPE